MTNQFRLRAFVFVALVMATAAAAWAQRDAASKIDGEAYEAPYFYSSVGAYQENAYAHAQVLEQATSSGKPIPQAVAKEHTEAIRANLKAAQRHHASLQAASKGKAAATPHLGQIEQHHAKALAHADAIDAAVKSGPGDAAVVNKSAKALAAELKSAHETHKKVAPHLTTAK